MKLPKTKSELPKNMKFILALAMLLSLAFAAISETPKPFATVNGLKFFSLGKAGKNSSFVAVQEADSTNCVVSIWNTSKPQLKKIVGSSTGETLYSLGKQRGTRFQQIGIISTNGFSIYAWPFGNSDILRVKTQGISSPNL